MLGQLPIEILTMVLQTVSTLNLSLGHDGLSNSSVIDPFWSASVWCQEGFIQSRLLFSSEQWQSTR